MQTRRDVLLAAGVLAFIPLSTGGLRTPRLVAGRDVIGAAPPAASVSYSPNDKEFYLTADQLDEVQPGYHITVNSVTIPADLRPIADLSFTDDLGQPLDRLGVATPGALSASLVLAWWDAGSRNYTAYTTRQQTSPNGVTATQAAADSGGTWTDLAIGHSTYRFKTVLPADYDKSKTHTLAIYGTRELTDLIGKDYIANVEYDFRPDAAPVTEIWDMIPNSACNTCHNPLAAHGGSRRDVKLCVTCHSPQTIDPDTGNTVDFKVMVHKIHMGENLPSVQAGMPYVIIGNNGSRNDFSDVVFPQDIRNCTTCHAPPATQSFNWFAYPSRAACASCHDDVNFNTGENHPAGAQVDDSACAACHQPVGDQEFDASIIGIHTVPSKSTQLKGLNAAILSVSNAHAGQKPTVVFQITENNGTVVSPSVLGSNLNLLMGGPSADYAIQPFRERADGSAFDGSTATYTFTHAIPANATGTWAFSLEARRTVTLDPPAPDTSSVTEAAFNPVAYASVDGSAVSPRRQVVDIALCNGCHGQLALHGGQRLNTEECVICHNPNGDDSSRRPADKNPPESIDFKRMIHRIHTGVDLTANGDTDCSPTSPTGTPDAFGCFTIYGFGTPPSVNNFNNVLYPGDRRDCVRCHVPGSQEVIGNPPSGWLSTATPRDWYTPQLHYAAACLGCHDGQSTANHAASKTTADGVETCVNCHGAGASLAVDKVHAR